MTKRLALLYTLAALLVAIALLIDAQGLTVVRGEFRVSAGCFTKGGK